MEDELRCRRLASDNSQISDWSLEVDEEEERRSQLGVSPPTGPGIIRVSESTGGGGGGPQWGPPPDSQHPAWRSEQTTPQQHHQPVHPSWSHTLPASLDHQKFLFDPSNPMKPIRMQGPPPTTTRDYQAKDLVAQNTAGIRFPIGAPRYCLPD